MLKTIKSIQCSKSLGLYFELESTYGINRGVCVKKHAALHLNDINIGDQFFLRTHLQFVQASIDIPCIQAIELPKELKCI